MGKIHRIDAERGSYEWEKERTERKKFKHEFNIDHRLGRLLSLSKNRAKNKNLVHTLTKQQVVELWEEQEGLCAVSGVELELKYDDKFHRNPNGPSIDRIVPDKGYTKDNVRLVTTQINLAISNFGEELFYLMCENVLENNQ